MIKKIDTIKMPQPKRTFISESNALAVSIDEDRKKLQAKFDKASEGLKGAKLKKLTAKFTKDMEDLALHHEQAYELLRRELG
jgi:hypothetical protein